MACVRTESTREITWTMIRLWSEYQNVDFAVLTNEKLRAMYSTGNSIVEGCGQVLQKYNFLWVFCTTIRRSIFWCELCYKNISQHIPKITFCKSRNNYYYDQLDVLFSVWKLIALYAKSNIYLLRWWVIHWSDILILITTPFTIINVK